MFHQIIMFFFVLLVGLLGLHISKSEPLTSSKGSYDLHTGSNNARKMAFIPYKMCLNSAPFFVNATVRLQDPSVSQRFKATVIEIDIHGFSVELERTDQSAGWEAKLVVDWIFYSGGDGIVVNKKYIWMSEFGGSHTRTQANNFCKGSGATLVDIVDKNMFDAVVKYVGSKLNGGTWTRFWLAMNYDPTNKVMSTSNGEASFNFNGYWNSGYPMNDPTFTAIVMEGYWDVSGVLTTRIRNRPPDSSLYTDRHLCAMPL